MRTRMRSILFVLLAVICVSAQAGEKTYRLYDGLTMFVDNQKGIDFTLTMDIRDINHRMHGPSEILVKVYPPDGRPVVREIIPDDGIVAPTTAPAAAGWDHEAWYYATSYSRGLEPLVRWSVFSDPARLAALPKRTFKYKIKGGQKGVYRVVIAGSPDHYVTITVDPDLDYGVAGNPEWLHGHHSLHKLSYIYVPKNTVTINLLFLQFDQPASRTVILKDHEGNILAEGSGSQGLVQRGIPAEGKYDDKILTLEISDGPGDYIVNVTHQIGGEFTPVRAKTQAVTAVLAKDRKTAEVIQGGAIYHDDNVFWQMYQVRLHDWLSTLIDEDFDYAIELDDANDFFSVGSHNSPKPRSADRIMHTWRNHQNPQALNAALKDMLFGMRLIGHGDHVAIGPKRNLAYEMGCYTYFWYRPAWRIIQESVAPDEVKEMLREFIIQTGDRLAFSRTMATGNGNAFGSLMEALRYCYEATGDEMQKKTFETVWKRFTTGGYGDRVGIGPSGGLQESLGYDLHYGSYVLRGWKAVIADLKDERFINARNRMFNMYSYVYAGNKQSGAPWCSRTGAQSLCGGSYDPWGEFRWKGFGGPDFTVAVNDHNEWFAARRRNYYMLTYHGRLTPTWEGEGFHGQIGLGGGGICQLWVPGKGKGLVIGGKPNSSYGKGMHLSQWRNFHIHSLVGTTADGKPLVTANSEHWNAKLEGTTITSSAEVRESSVVVTRKYEYGPGAIKCEVSLTESIHDNVFGLWGGRPALRGKVTEAYEMIPFHDLAKRKGKARPQDKRRTKVTVLDAAGAPVMLLDDRSVGKPPVAGAGVLIDPGGYGAMIQFDKVRPVTRGQNDTILVELIEGRTPASAVSFSYTIVPYATTPPQFGELVGGGPKEHLIARLAAIESLDEVAAALGSVEPVSVPGKKGKAGDIRFGIAGDSLILSADVVDTKIVHHNTAWKGSSVELFASKPNTFGIRQIFLVPATGGKAAAGYLAKSGGQTLTPDVKVKSEMTQTGYTLQAIVPLSLLKLNAEDGKFLLEFQIDSNVRGRGMEYQTMFGSRLAYENNQSYRLFCFELTKKK